MQKKNERKKLSPCMLHRLLGQKESLKIKKIGWIHPHTFPHHPKHLTSNGYHNPNTETEIKIEKGRKIVNIKRHKCVDAIYCKKWKVESESGPTKPRILVTGQKKYMQERI